ncbi:alpha/beta fold hydrolase [Muricoccus radiodurans]|uniref:alpha/beta fold hydrolase n=1 Tax=Muricoccus radiodurans TaxID=2231721 RepID=UPI003CF727A0
MIPHAHVSGAGSPVLLLHGIGGNGGLWGPVLPGLSGRQVLAWDMPGYGQSAPLPQVTFPALAKALLALMDARGLEQADLLGHSIGGMIAIEFAATHPERVRRLALVATSAAFGSRDPAFAESFVRARIGPLDEGRRLADLAPGLAAGMLGTDPDPAALPAATAAMAAVPEASYRATVACLTTFDRRDALADLRMPVLLVAGGEDRIAPPRGMARMQSALPDARLAVIEGAGHLPHLERPDAFNAALRPFLDEAA